jgi:DNA-binding beta-propeller fold protein YncE
MNTTLKKLACAGIAAFALAACAPMSPPAATGATPRFAVDPYWPKPLPDNQILGQVAGINVDSRDHVWIVHRPATLLDDEKGAQLNPPTTHCCNVPMAVLEFDQEGNLLRNWGGPGAGYDWPKSEHGIFVDKEGNVWLAGNEANDNQILKFTADGKFLQQIGHAGPSEGSNSKTQLGRPAGIEVDEAANELYVADGYGNRRVIVFDSKTGLYKRHWGAYGNKPADDKTPAYSASAPLPQQFGNPVHCARPSRDALVYVCDRVNDRIQVFHKDGSFVKEFRFAPETLQNGSVWDLVLSEDPQQKFIFMVDGASGRMAVLSRDNGALLSIVGGPGRMAGQFRWVHNIAIDSKGNVYTSEVGYGRRVQKFKRVE